MPEFKSLTAKQIADGVNTGSLNAVELTSEALRLAKGEGKVLNAFISLCEDKAYSQAKAVGDRTFLDSARNSEAVPVGNSEAVPVGNSEAVPVGNSEAVPVGNSDGVSFPRRRESRFDHEKPPLAGVPIAIKDNISYTGYPCSCGSHILDGYIPPYDATVVTRLVDAGAVIIGKTNLDEFAMGSSTENSYYGPVKNPVCRDLVPGGSSGGSAAAVAQKIVPLALGSETGGSVRQPASFCGIFGLKPTYGAVSRYGLVSLASSTDQISPFARNTEDLALLFSVICGQDEHDSTSVAFDHPDYPNLLQTDRKFRIGIPKEHFGKGLDVEVEAVVHLAIDRLKQAGHTFVDISLPMSEKAIAVYYVIMCAEASANLARFDGVKYGLRESGDKSLFEMYADTRSRGFGAEVKRRIMLGTYTLSSGYYDAYYLKAARVRELMRQEMENAFKSVDLIISPTAPTPAFKMGEKINDPLAMYLSDIYTATANLTLNPAISVPCGAVPDGRPVGVQFMAPYMGELSLFQISHILERLR